MEKDTDRGRRSGSGFTLVELLVVIGIIAILIGILLPALSRARAKSKQIACMANMREVHHALEMYANDNRDRWPDWDTMGGYNYRRRPGLLDPTATGSYREWKGLPALLHGIRPIDFTPGAPQNVVNDGVEQMLKRPARYLSATSNVWLCYAFPAVFTEYGNTYAWYKNPGALYTRAMQNGVARLKNPTLLYLWDNSSFLPYTPGWQCPASTPGGFSISTSLYGGQIYPHPSTQGRKAKGQGSRNELLVDGSVRQAEL